MLTRILHNSPQLCTFFNQLDIELHQPQRRHILNIADALLVCEDKKTLAALQRQFVEAPDASNMADFLRISPWQANDVRAALRVHQVAWLIAEAERADAPKVIYINIDDSLGEKDQDTRHLEPVDWHYDHSESTRSKPRYKNAFCYVACTLRIGRNVATVDLRLYLRERTVRQLNRKRSKEQRIPFRSKYRIARQILAELRPLVPQGWRVYVQFDSWYASRKLIKYVRRQRWHVTCGLKCNRKLDRQTHRPTRPGAQAPVVHASQRNHCGRGQANLLCATAGWPFSRCPLRRPRLLLEKAPQGEIPGVHRMYGSRLLGQTGFARLRLAMVVRNRQLLPEDPNRIGGLPRPVLRGGGQIHNRRPFGLGLRRATFCSGTFCPAQDLRRHDPAASGRACHRLVDRRHRIGCRNRRCRNGSPAFFALGNTARLVFDCLPTCPSPGFNPMSTPGGFRMPPFGRQVIVLFCC